MIEKITAVATKRKFILSLKLNYNNNYSSNHFKFIFLYWIYFLEHARKNQE